nr:N-acetyltransferase [Lactobacillus amylovorus]
HKRQTEIWAGTFANNEKSQKLLQRLGFHYVYTVDYSQVSALFSFKEKYYLLKKEEWLKIDANTKS